MTKVNQQRLRDLLDKATPELFGAKPHRIAQMLRDGANCQVPKADNLAQVDFETDAALILEAVNALPSLLVENERLTKTLEPFAAMGRVMEYRLTFTFGKTPPDSEIVCASSGEVGTGILTMGHFRDAVALLPKAPGWGGVYQPSGARTLLGDS